LDGHCPRVDPRDLERHGVLLWSQCDRSRKWPAAPVRIDDVPGARQSLRYSPSAMPTETRGQDQPERQPVGGGATARLGVDVGGTFTDLALWDADGRRLTVFKLPSVPRDPSEGILAGIRAMTERDRVAVSALGFVAHGTTVATNALLEKRG